MIAWKFGIEKAPDGSRVREIPVKYVWSSSVWISQDGTVFRRFYNAMLDRWTWQGPQPYIFDKSGRQGIYLLDVFTPLSKCIALAWLHRNPGSPARTKLESGLPPDAENLRWVEMGSNKEGGKYEDETWSDLKWMCGIKNCPSSYQISNRARLKAPTGEVTAGFYYADSMWAAVHECGLVDLLAAAGRKPKEKRLGLPERLGMDCIMTGHNFKDLSRDFGKAESTAWSYITRGAAVLDPADLQRMGPNLVSSDVWKALHDLQKRGDTRLGGSLKELLPVVEEMLEPRSDFILNKHKMSELRLARLCITSTCSSLDNCVDNCA